MSSSLIQSYLKDTSIPEASRRSVQQQMRSGYDIDKMERLLSSKYGDKYGRPGEDIFASSGGRVPSVRSQMGLGEKMGNFAQNLGGAMQQYAKDTGLDQKVIPADMFDPKPEPTRRDERREDGKLLHQRIGSAAQSFGGAVKDTFGNIVEAGKERAEGREIRKTGKEGMETQKNLMAQLEQSFKEGGMSQEDYQRIGGQIQVSFDKAKAMAGQGQEQIKDARSGLVKGAADLVVSPFAAIPGALKPELQKAGEKIGGFVENLSPENQKRLEEAKSGIEAGWNKFDKRTQNYLGTVFNLAGLGLAKSGTQAASKALQPLAKGFKEGAEQVIKAAPGMVDDLGRGLKGAAGKAKGVMDDVGKNLPVVGSKAKSAKNLSSADDLLRPLPTQKNLQEAAAAGRAKLGEKGLFRGAKDSIELSPRMQRSAKTLAEKFPDLKKLSPVALPAKIKDKISEIANPLKEQFQKMPVSPKVRDKMTKTWEKVKKTQAQDPNFSLGVDKMQTNFESNYLKQLTKQFKGKDGKFRQPTADDVWDVAKAYDDSIKSNVKNATEASAANFQVQKEAWLENRRVLRDIMEDLAKSADDPGIKKAFEEMADLYEATSQIIKNVKPTNRSGRSKFGDLVNEYKKQLITVGGGGAVYSALKD